MKSPGVQFPPPLPFAAAIVAGWWFDLRLHLPIPGVAQSSIAPLLSAVLMVGALVLLFVSLAIFFGARTGIYPNRPATTLVARGPYRFSRNPMYLAMALLTVGAGVAVNSAWPLLLGAVALGAVYLLVVRREEAYLLSVFGDQYLAYCAKVRRWI